MSAQRGLHGSQPSRPLKRLEVSVATPRMIAPLATCVLLAGAPLAMAERWNRSETPSAAADEHDKTRAHRRYRHEDADRIVRRAYQDILDREPDEAGLPQYRGRLIDDGWSEAQSA